MLTTLIALTLLLGQVQVALAAQNALLSEGNTENIEFIAPPQWIAHSAPQSQSERMAGKIRYWASVYSVDENLLQDLAEFESGFDPLAKNPNSSARGIFQFLTGSWRTYCEGNVYDPDDNAKCAARLISEGGISHWTQDPAVKNYLLERQYVSCYNSFCRLR